MTVFKSGKALKSVSHVHATTIRKTLTPTATARMQEALRSAPYSLDDLVAISGLSKPVVTRYVKELYEANPKMVYVADWGRDRRGYPTIRKYQLGAAQDMACPRTDRTAKERMRDLRDRRKAGV